jgi:hypothetical protein
MQAGRFFFVLQLTDRSSERTGRTLLAFFPACPAFSPGNFFADFLDRPVIY